MGNNRSNKAEPVVLNLIHQQPEDTETQTGAAEREKRGRQKEEK